MLCRLMSEYGSVCDRQTLRVGVGKSKVMRCSKYENVGRMHGKLNYKRISGLFKVPGVASVCGGRM